MILRQFLVSETACASYLFGCTTHNKLAVVDAHANLLDDYLAAAAAIGSPRCSRTHGHDRSSKSGSSLPTGPAR